MKKYVLYAAVVTAICAILLTGALLPNPAKEQAKEALQSCIQSESDCANLISDYQERFGENP
ncbi:hypothetical protein EBL_c19970 [Shimwellia blattae DSM 4481 = NBRC 105725]|uniref:Uncharacterized protein n=1 Tax=Shimwellia blattae (strain ATCC 29907 / DSM 4481 / JCM 1650 / NBRC 105725 / CDC 9005-74) TaxID=630626 RepID=I2B984_SHIBC|nr:hypothetical protein EBL_c19970 [Shimwellia blattae DSM 4481 = NBRC 105725]GAB80790.1 hypothetical protein EB105725_09_00160 [Shimwellia blattae DSM 4481 = NBRC 105725]VDY64581.1 Uncharacterised protein [Shimwellia blattae]VEC22689.1 Uncharacterised protein [Shimwellia blattae]